MGFADRNGAAVEIRIDEEGWEGAAVELTPGASPLTLQEDDTEGLDTPSRAWTGRLTVVAEDGVDLSGLYAPEVTSSRVTVRRDGQTVWVGYVSPAVVRQSWVGGDEVTVSVQSPLAAMEGLTLDASAGFGYVTLGELLQEVARLTGDWQMVAFPDDLSVALPEVAADSRTDSWMDVEVSRYAFFEKNYDEGDFDDSEEARVTYTGATGREVVEAICRLLGWTAMERAGVLWLVAESAPGYQTVSVGQLDAPGRTLTPTVVAELALDDLNAAGTDHTVSQLRGYRRVRVTFTPDTVDDLLDELDEGNWQREGEYDLYGDMDITTDPEDAYYGTGRYVASRSPYMWIAGTSDSVTGGAQIRLATFGRKSLSGMSVGTLYQYATTESGTRAKWNRTPYIYTQKRDVWYRESDDNPEWLAVTWRGAERAKIRVRTATIEKWDEGQFTAYDYPLYYYAHGVLASPPDKSDTFDGVLVWLACNKHVPPAGEEASAPEPREVFDVETPYEVYLNGGALKLGATFTGFIGADAIMTTSWAKIGPVTPTKGFGSYDGISSWTFQLSVGNRYWNGEHWQASACTFDVELDDGTGDGDADQSDAESAHIKPSQRVNDPARYVDGEDGYILPLVDETGADVVLTGRVKLRIYDKWQRAIIWGEAGSQVLYNMVMISDLSMTHLPEVDETTLYDTDGAGSTGGRAHNYVAETGCATTEDLKDVELTAGTWDGDAASFNVLRVAGDIPLGGFKSKRQGGMVARPERLVLSVLRRLYGRARRQLTVEVDAAGIEPGAVVRDGQTRYALSGVEWDVSNARCKYTFEDFIPFDQWAER